MRIASRLHACDALWILEESEDPDWTGSLQSEALRDSGETPPSSGTIAWNAVFGRLGGLGQDPCLDEEEEDPELSGEGCDEDPEPETEREKRIKKGRIARAAARKIEGGAAPMPTRKNSIGGQEAPGGADSRRDSVGSATRSTTPGRTTRKAAAPGGTAQQRSEQQKRKNSIDPGEAGLKKGRTMSTEPEPTKTEVALAEMKALCRGWPSRCSG